ncbi:DinB family protein [Paenibacillus harenae]|uniref:DinB family protein n=1 Tax=Paenibacillus harenae TaxID=306543 RepID=UPI0003F5FBA8|nr:DinB family protein [Paenibacillus harenae]
MGLGKKAVFADQLALCHNEKGWFPTIQDALEGLGLDQAAWKDGSQHSIGELVTHLTYWNERHLNRFRGEAVDEHHGNESTFETAAAITSETQWRESVERLYEVLTDWKKQLLECEEAKLEEAIPGDPDSSWWELLSCLTSHNAYHLGQMILIRKQQGLWPKNINS